MLPNRSLSEKFGRIELRIVAIIVAIAVTVAFGAMTPVAMGQNQAVKNRWEVTPESQKALQSGLEWMAKNQTESGNWGNRDLGIVSLGMLAFLADGHTPGHGKHGATVKRSLDHVMSNARSSGLLTIPGQHEMYNHGLSTFVLGQAYGMTDDKRVGPALDKALKLIVKCQGPGGGWTYTAEPGDHDLSLCVMQAKALRSAIDSGFEVPPAVIDSAIGYVRSVYAPEGCDRNQSEDIQQKFPGRFTYSGDIGGGTVAMAAAGVVCMQEFGQYEDWRIPKSVDFIESKLKEATNTPGTNPPFDAYTTYYVAQALYQVGGESWKRSYPLLRDRIIASQIRQSNNASQVGSWGGDVFLTSVCCFVLAIPNRFLPILQEGKVDYSRRNVHPK